jgi:putative ABC transport system permease protein
MTADALHSSIESFTDILAITELASLALALLVAYNTAAITIDERSREHATMFAFGVPLRTVLRISLIESLVMGMLGTIIGIGLGYAVVTYVVRVLTPAVLPEVGASVTLSSRTLLIAILLSTTAAIMAPLLSGRRLQRMDIPSTLRVVE